MALSASSSTRAHDGPTTLTIDGRLVATVELQKFPTDHQPFHHLWLFRSPSGLTLLTVARHERWRDDGSVDLEKCSALATTVSFTTVADLATGIRSRYGDIGWRELLGLAAPHDHELFGAWAPSALERDLLRATFYRPDLVRRGPLGRTQLDALADELIAHLEDAGFGVTDIAMAKRANPNSEMNRIAISSVQRYGYEADIVARIDPAGEIYTRVEETDGQLAIRRLEDSDA